LRPGSAAFKPAAGLRRGVTDVDLPLDHVHVAPDDPSDRAVVVLHGRGANERDLLPVARELPPHHVVSLRAPERMGPGYTWYDLDLSAGGLHASQPDPDGFRRSLDLVAESVAAARDAYGVETVGLLGFSQGAITSLSLLLEDPDAYAWVVALHGYLAERHADLSPAGVAGTPVFVGAGDRDEVIPAARAAAAADRLRDLDADVTHRTYPTGHGIGRAELDDVVAFVEAASDSSPPADGGRAEG
jgi:phospholipase/carboxylesterase